MHKIKIIILLSLILIITFITFFPSLNNGFNYDDDLYVINNRFIESPSAYNFKKIFTSSFAGNYQPATIFSYLVEYQIFKLSPRGYHITNLALHLFNCCLVFWLFYLLGRNIPVALLTSIFFAIHPLRVESVAWISERKDLLYALFFLGALISYLYYLKKKKTLRFYYLTLLLFVLSLLSKPMAVTLPLVLLLFDYLVREKQNKINFLNKVPFIILSMIFGVVAFLSQSASGAIRQESLYNALDKLTNITYAIIFYLHKLFIPLRLTCLYPFPDNAVKLSSVIFIILLLLSAALFIKKTRSKIFIHSSIFFLITILPVLQIIPLGGTLVSDRYSYIPLLGLYYLGAYGFFVLYNSRTRYTRLIQISLIIILIATISTLSFLTRKQCKVWKDGLTLWSDVLNKYPNFVTALNNRGYLFMEIKDYDKALLDFKHALSVSSGYNQSRYIYLNLGSLYYDIGKKQEAIATFGKALEIYPNDAEIYFKLGFVYNAINKKEAAEAAYKKAIKLNPSHSMAYYNLGMLCNSLDKKEEATEMFEKTRQISPDYLPAYFQLINLYKIPSKKEEILSLYKEIIKNNLDYFDAYYNIGNLFSDTGKVKEAIILYKKAVKIDPNSAEAYVGLGTSYCVMGKNKEAIRVLEKAIKLNPDILMAYNNLAVAYYYEKKYDLAIKHCDKAIKLGYQVCPRFLETLKRYRLPPREVRQ